MTPLRIAECGMRISNATGCGLRNPQSAFRNPQYTNARGLAVGNLIVALVVIAAISGIVLLVISGQPGRPDDPIYNYSSVDLPPTDPALIHYRQVAEIRLQFDKPRGLAVDAQRNVYVAGEYLERTCWLAPGEIPPPGSPRKPVQLPQPGQCVAVDSAGQAYVGLKDRVAVVGPDYKLEEWPAIGGNADISSIACTPDGKDVFVADRGNSFVVHFDGDGKIVGYIGRDEETRKPNRYRTQMLRCFDLAIGTDGLLRVVDPDRHAIDTYSLDGRLEHRLELPRSGVEGSHGCCNPTDIAMFPDGRMAAADKGTLLPRVKVYDDAGKMVSVVAGPGTFANDEALLDLAVDGAGRVYVLDKFRKTVRVFEKLPQTSSQSRPGNG